MFDIANPVQGYGELSVEIVEVSNLNFNQIKAFKDIQLLKASPIPFQMRVSFNAVHLDTDNSPLIFSS